MGARLVGHVLATWTHVSEPAFRILVRMAHVALDEPNGDREAGLYFGGWELLAMTLRTVDEVPAADELDDQRRKLRASLKERIRRATAELVDAGAIERTIVAPRIGNRQVYRLNVGQLSVVPEGQLSIAPEGQLSVVPEGQLSVGSRGNSELPPRNQEEPRKELRQEPRVKPRTESSDRAHARHCLIHQLDMPCSGCRADRLAGDAA